MSTMLYAVEVPPEGSDTLLADLCAAWNALPPERQKALDGLILHHSYVHLMETRLYSRVALSDEIKAENPDVFHPLVRTHPADGRKAKAVGSTGTVEGQSSACPQRGPGLIATGGVRHPGAVRLSPQMAGGGTF